jgi:uncharacterized protein YndB with AHSA1/START domain
METLDKHFVISRVFDAPRDLVWKLHTEAEHLKHWWGPKGFEVTHAQVDLRPGGLFHYCLRMPDGGDVWGKWVFQEITPPERLVVITSFSDKDGGTGRHPMSPTWPLEMHSVMTFAEEGGRTRVTIDWIPQNATEIERKTFAESHDSMRGGFTGTFERLAAYLARIRG